MQRMNSSTQELVHHYAASPHVNFLQEDENNDYFCIGLVASLLRGHINQSPNFVIKLIIRTQCLVHCTKTKVNDFDVQGMLASKKNVFWLQISVDIVLIVDEVNSLKNVLHHLPCLIF